MNVYVNKSLNSICWSL